MTTLSLSNIGCPPLERDIEASLALTAGAHGRAAGGAPTVEALFHEAMQDVANAIERHERFRVLERFIAYGSLVPDWETHAINQPGCLDDSELARCIDFISGQMTSKFQGKLGELLAGGAIARLVARLQEEGTLPPRAELVLGDAIRCRGRGERLGPKGARGIQGPDALVIERLAGERLAVLALVEVKSMRRSRSQLERQIAGHRAAVNRGVRIAGEWWAPQQIAAGARESLVIVVRPSSWRLTHEFRLEPDEAGTLQVVMAEQELPAASEQVRLDENWGEIELAWSWDALRAAAFGLVSWYMAEVAQALEPALGDGWRERGMSPDEAGPNDFMAQLHVAIFRQQNAEPNPRKREKTIELYNVLGFGWAIGHGFRDVDGEKRPMFFEDLEELARRR